MSIGHIDTDYLSGVLKRLESEFSTSAEVARKLNISQAHIHNFVSGKREPSPTLVKALRNKGYLPSLPKRIRSQITWESEEQKEYFQKSIVERGFNSPTEYLRDIANQRIEWKHIYAGWDAIWKDV